jgi:ribosome-associated protein
MNQAVEIIMDELSSQKGENILYVDTTEKTHPIADYILVVSASNYIHIKSLVNAVLKFYKKNKGAELSELDFRGVSGTPESKWMIIDFNDFLIHVMDKELRDMYAFDQLFERYNTLVYHGTAS